MGWSEGLRMGMDLNWDEGTRRFEAKKALDEAKGSLDAQMAGVNPLYADELGLQTRRNVQGAQTAERGYNPNASPSASTAATPFQNDEAAPVAPRQELSRGAYYDDAMKTLGMKAKLAYSTRDPNAMMAVQKEFGELKRTSAALAIKNHVMNADEDQFGQIADQISNDKRNAYSIKPTGKAGLYEVAHEGEKVKLTRAQVADWTAAKYRLSQGDQTAMDDIAKIDDKLAALEEKSYGRAQDAVKNAQSNATAESGRISANASSANAGTHARVANEQIKDYQDSRSRREEAAKIAGAYSDLTPEEQAGPKGLGLQRQFNMIQAKNGGQISLGGATGRGPNTEAKYQDKAIWAQAEEKLIASNTQPDEIEKQKTAFFERRGYASDNKISVLLEGRDPTTGKPLTEQDYISFARKYPVTAAELPRAAIPWLNKVAPAAPVPGGPRPVPTAQAGMVTAQQRQQAEIERRKAQDLGGFGITLPSFPRARNIEMTPEQAQEMYNRNKAY